MNPSIPKRYEVRSLLGEGGSGRVYRVYDSIRDRELALKLVTAGESAFLRREFDTLRQIRHENLIQVFDWGALPSGEAYYTMELIEGGDWSRRMGKPQSPDEVRHILTGLLRGLAHLHCHGEIHGDLKPGNILLGAGGVVKITDAGMGGSEGLAEGLSGTPGYAAPEVWEGSPADARSDIYSVGVMAYEALSGKHPFAGRTVRDVVSGQLEGWVPSLGVHGIRVPIDLERVVMRALERKPGMRQGSTDELMEGMGIQDRVGEILGGKLVGRNRELQEIEMMIHSDQPGMATLLHIHGEPGVGKSALLDEACARLITRGGRALQIDLGRGKPLEELIREYLAPQEEWGGEGRQDWAEDLQSMLWKAGQRSPVLLCQVGDDGAVVRQLLKSLARYVWALSLDNRSASHVVIVLQSTTTCRPSEQFEREVSIPPLEAADCGFLLEKTLGQSSVQRELIDRLHALSGGNPGVLRSALASLIDGQLLQRRDGRWMFRETTQIHSLRLDAGINPWVISWRHLTPGERNILLTLSLFRAPLPLAKVMRLCSGESVKTTLSSLQAKGFVRNTREGWSCASESVMHAIHELASPESQAQTAAVVLNSLTDSSEAEEKADLELRYRPSVDALNRGFRAAELALDRGDQYLGIARLRICLEICERAGLESRSRDICLGLAVLLRQLGDEDGALSYLQDHECWSNGLASASQGAGRNHTLGLISMAKGDLESSRQQLTKGVEMAAKTGDQSLLLRCHADLAELDWRHGDEQTRLGVIDRVRSVLTLDSRDGSLRNERAALMYELGAAMIVAGQSRDSTGMLCQALETADSDYWKMRISNALASANHYLGDLDEELKWLDRAWTFAERSRSDSFKARILSNRGGMLYHNGHFSEAADQNRLSASWARRVGNRFEYIAGCLGVGICNIHLANYEIALATAAEVMTAAKEFQDPNYVARALEIAGLANYFLGLEEPSRRCVRDALASLRNRGHMEVKPRLDWLLARILRGEGKLQESMRLLVGAETKLLETKDPEDLWGVQIEINLVRAQTGDPETAIRSIVDILRESEEKRFFVVAVPAALAIGDILDEHGSPGRNLRDVLAVGLERAERAGMRELAWRLSYRMGSLAWKAGEKREGQIRSAHAIRILREIAGALTEDHRKNYLAATHVASALHVMGAS